ncbi:MAG: ABC transporter substrate-binding protein [Thermodesulfobacteriota bacterium]
MRLTPSYCSTILGLLLCLSILAGNAAPARAGDRDVVLGMSAAFTGPSRGLGIELYRGAMAYFRHVNDNGGLFGRKLAIRAMDDGYNPGPAILNTIQFIEQDDVLALFNYVGTPTVTRVLPLLKKFEDRHILLLFPFTGAEPQRQPPYDAFVFNLRASYLQETRALVDRLVSLGRTRIAIFYQVDAYGRSGWHGVQRALAGHGLSIATEATYRRGASFADSMAEQVRIIAQAEPDAVVSIGSYEACAAFVRDARNAGLTAPIANISFVGSQNMVNLLRKAGEEGRRDYCGGQIITQVVPTYEDLSLPVVAEYRELMDRYADTPLPAPALASNPPYPPLRYSFTSYEGFLNAKVLVEALRAFGRTPRREDMRLVLESFTSGDIGMGIPVSFGPQRHQGLDAVYFTTVHEYSVVPIRNWSEWGK